MKIAVYAIAKNEEQFVERFCSSAQEADYIIIADTGSTDKTVELARQYTTHVYTISISPWRFDKARDAALALVPADADVCISMDLDEVLQSGWREEIERVWQQDTTRLKYLYDWGNGIQYYYEKIHHRNGYYWKHPCHEYPEPDGRITEVYAITDKLLIKHHPDNTKSRAQYLTLLELGVKEDPHCPRIAFYYARELFFSAKWDEAIEAFLNYIAMPEANWDVEISYAMRLIGKCFMYKKQIHDAVKWFRQSTAIDPHSREAWTDLAQGTYIAENWNECFSACMNGISITESRKIYIKEPSAWGTILYDLGSICAWNLGAKEQALELIKTACEIDPRNERFKSNMTFYKNSIIDK